MSAREGKDTLHSQLEHLQMKYVGTGHADTNKFEWGVNIQRDTYSSYVGHHGLMQYFATALNEPTAKLRFQFLDKMYAPCGAPPPQEDDDAMDEDENSKSTK